MELLITGTHHIQLNQQTQTYLNFNGKVVGPFNIDEVFQNELILDEGRKTSRSPSFCKY